MRSTTNPPERRRLAIGSGLIALLVVALILSWPEREAPPMPAPATAPPASALQAPSPPVATPPPAPSASPQGLRLHGILGAGAIIGGADGSQRFVALGREAAPGLTLASVQVDHVRLRGSTGSYRLDFAGASTAGAAPAAEAPGSEAGLREETMRYRLALAPRQSGGRVTGHAIRAEADLPSLARAGLLPGDVILRVNGSQFDAERLEELAWTLANSDEVNFEIERNGRPMRLAMRR